MQFLQKAIKRSADDHVRGDIRLIGCLTDAELFNGSTSIRAEKPTGFTKTIDYANGGSMYPGKSYKSMGLEQFYKFMYEECVWRRRQDGEQFPDFGDWLMGEDHATVE